MKYYAASAEQVHHFELDANEQMLLRGVGQCVSYVAAYDAYLWLGDLIRRQQAICQHMEQTIQTDYPRPHLDEQLSLAELRGMVHQAVEVRHKMAIQFAQADDLILDQLAHPPREY